jgi:FkbM family methyltransferase
MQKLKDYGTAASELGPAALGTFLWQRLLSRITGRREPFLLSMSGTDHRLAWRPGTSDDLVFNQIFIHRAYECVTQVHNPGLIVDCGANVGYSAVYFLNKFPDCQVLALEPDAGNFEMLQLNTAPYGPRCRALQAAVWSEPTRLVLSDAPFGDGREWARSVRRTRPGENASIPAIDIGSILKESGFERIAILKVDIEGSEAAVFGAGTEAWLPCVDVLVVEEHGERCAAIVNRAAQAHGFRRTRHGELSLYSR